MHCQVCGREAVYCIAGNFREGGGGQIFVEHWTTNILPPNEATLATSACSGTFSNHENIKDLTNILTPENCPLYSILHL